MKLKALLFIILASFAFGAPAYAQSLAGLSDDDRSSIELACIVAKSEGPATYHSCLNRQLTRLGRGKAPNLDALSNDDRSSIELACIVAKSEGPATYHSCLNQQLTRLGRGEAPNLGVLSDDDRFSIELACIVAKSEGPATYHSCLNRQLARLSPAFKMAKATRRQSVAEAVSNIVTTTSGTAQIHAEATCAVQRERGYDPFQACVARELLKVKPPLVAIPAAEATSTVVSVKPLPVATPATIGACAENGSCYGDISATTGKPKTVAVHGYTKADGTYVRGYYRSK